ncbi:putative folate-biopterin transporter 2 [Senna tora]|uniref:Putative folate-biopterin transporter 2 n=1 Tax=Senna tora TaxID=362788 RepID=A0A834SDB0_9FABA|nr:putative folate-biopterin transporter 2 [Senna tora]
MGGVTMQEDENLEDPSGKEAMEENQHNNGVCGCFCIPVHWFKMLSRPSEAQYLVTPRVTLDLVIPCETNSSLHVNLVTPYAKCYAARSSSCLPHRAPCDIFLA